jgi:hypothetical protein
MKSKPFDLERGAKYARLTAVEPCTLKSGRKGWVLQCECGGRLELRARSVVLGKTRSCGCLRAEVSAERMTTHGRGSARPGRKDITYSTWCSIKKRCSAKSGPSYRDYVQRGITVCVRWADSFEAFVEDVGLRPSKAHTIERKDNDAGYFKENCRWATKSEQARNRRSNRLVTVDGVTKSLAEWCELTGVSQHDAGQRLNKLGWDEKSAVTVPARKFTKRRAA